MATSKVFSSFGGWWATKGNTNATAAGRVMARVRTVRIITRLWFDILMPVAVLSTAAGGVPPLRQTVLLVTAMTLVHTGITVLNDLQDREIDRNSLELLRRTRPIAQGVIAPRTATREAVVLVILGILAAFGVSLMFGAIATVLTLALLLYEVPPVRIQGRPVVSQVAPLLGGVLLFVGMVYAVPTPRLDLAVPLIVFIAFYLGICETLVKDVRDVDNDEKGGKHTTAVKYGAPRATAVCAGCYAVALALWVWLVQSFPGPSAPLWTAAVLLLAWVGYVAWAAVRLSRAFSKGICISLHTGSIVAFASANAAIVATLWS